MSCRNPEIGLAFFVLEHRTVENKGGSGEPETFDCQRCKLPKSKYELYGRWNAKERKFHKVPKICTECRTERTNKFLEAMRGIHPLNWDRIFRRFHIAIHPSVNNKITRVYESAYDKEDLSF